MTADTARVNALDHAIKLQQTKLSRQQQAVAATKEIIKVLEDQLDLFTDKTPTKK